MATSTLRSCSTLLKNEKRFLTPLFSHKGPKTYSKHARGAVDYPKPNSGRIPTGMRPEEARPSEEDINHARTYRRHAAGLLPASCHRRAHPGRRNLLLAGNLCQGPPARRSRVDPKALPASKRVRPSATSTSTAAMTRTTAPPTRRHGNTTPGTPRRPARPRLVAVSTPMSSKAASITAANSPCARPASLAIRSASRAIRVGAKAPQSSADRNASPAGRRVRRTRTSPSRRKSGGPT